MESSISTDFEIGPYAAPRAQVPPDPYMVNPYLTPDTAPAAQDVHAGMATQGRSDTGESIEAKDDHYAEDPRQQYADKGEIEAEGEANKETKRGKGGKGKKKRKGGKGKGKGGGEKESPFILYKEGEAYFEALDSLRIWVNGLIVPVYGRETSSQLPWCPRWWEHVEAVAQFYGLWMAWQDLTGAESTLSGPANWHRDHLAPVMESLRSPTGPFSGCKPGHHRPKDPPIVENV
ncbi:DUF4913 domain-containing protein [Streptomyces sp. NPDC026665]|uniref:DUF4913 domain-containing protein n=1 Tax=Streptomyces sp. NPDC026665 TaxID=3154798 RepID=UPI0033F2AC5E